MSRELDAEVSALVMGWQGVWVQVQTAAGPHLCIVDVDGWPEQSILEAGGCPPGKDPKNEDAYTTVPEYSTDLNACFEAQAKCIEKVGKHQWFNAIRKALALGPTPDREWVVIASEMTAEQRCRAMLLALGEKE